MTHEIFETDTNVWKDLGCEAEVSLRTGETLMAKVSGEQRQFGIEIFALSVPTLQVVYSKGMTKLMQSRSLPPALMRNTAFTQEMAEDCVDRYRTVRGIIRGWKKHRFRRRFTHDDRVLL